MNDLQYFMDEANKYYEAGMRHKDIAIKDDHYLDEYAKADEAYIKASDYVDKAIEANGEEPNFKVANSPLKEYYLYEAADCRYAFEYKHNRFDNAIEAAKDAEIHIKQALKIIDDNFDTANDKAQKTLSRHRINWTLSALSIRIKVIEPIAKRAMLNKEYIKAMDAYRKLDRIQDQVHEYVNVAPLDEVYKRTENANYLACKASVAMSLVGVYNVKKGNYDKEMLEQLLIAYNYSKQSLNANPEQDRYKEGIENITENINVVLTRNKGWRDFLIEFKDNQDLIKFMQKKDNAKYKRESAKLELEKDGFKKFLLTGAFWVVIFFGIVYVVMNMAESNMAWYRLLAAFLVIPIFFTVLGAFILRTTNGLKEENFMKLMTLALKINLQGLKVLGSKKDTEEKNL
jgi:hypothetical protein